MDLARSPVIEYECPVSSGGCGARFNSLQAAELVGADFNFHCEHCNGVLETVLDGAGAGDEKQRRSRLAAMKKLQVWHLIQAAAQRCAIATVTIGACTSRRLSLPACPDMISPLGSEKCTSTMHLLMRAGGCRGATETAAG